MNGRNTAAASARQREYAQLQALLAQTGWISQGYVQARGLGQGAVHYAWTRKVKAKTVCVALSKQQYEWLKQAIANWRAVQKMLHRMQCLSREELFTGLPNPRRRKRLGKKLLGLV
jgi:hypothetical protein